MFASWPQTETALKSLCCSVAILLFTLFNVHLARCDEHQREKLPHIDQVSIFQKGDSLYLSFFLGDGLTDSIKKVIKSGITVKYIFDITLEKNRFLWNEKLVSIQTIKTVTFDNLRNRYFIMQGHPSTKVFSIEDMEKVKKYLLEIKEIKLIRLKDLEKGNKYIIKIRAKCEKEKDSISFSRFVNLFSSFGFSTNTYEFEFVY